MDAIETPRLILRRWRDEDLDAFAEIFAKTPVMRYSSYRRGLTREESEHYFGRVRAHWDEHGLGMRAAILREEGRLIGYIGHGVPVFLPEILPAVEVGYRIDPGYWGRGLATEGAAACIDQGFTAMGLERIVAIYEPENVASGRVMQKLGMRLDRDTIVPEEGTPVRVFAITRAEWQMRR